MPRYFRRSRRHQIYIADKYQWVDSKTEASVLFWLESHGFHDKWQRHGYGIKVGRSRYTPDVELCIRHNDMDVRAVVEIKATIRHFTTDIRRRMCGIATHYPNSILMLYVADTRTWYTLDPESRTLTICPAPTPGDAPIAQLPKPFSLVAPSVYHHQYVQKFNLLTAVLGFIASVLEEVIVGPAPRRRRHQSQAKRP